MKIYKWNELYSEDMSFLFIKNLYQPSFKYRIQEDYYELYSKFYKHSSGVTTYYIIEGEILYTNEETLETFKVSNGDFFKLPSGKFWCEVTSNYSVNFVKVLEIPDEILN